MKVIPVIICGGAGMRLWPVSRNSMPKQFIPLLGKESTFQRIAAAVGKNSDFGDLVVITNADYCFTVLDQLQTMGISAQIVLEPVCRDSAAAVAVATELALQHSPDAIVVVLADDHVIQTMELFVETCMVAANAALDKRIVAIGIPPTHPATGYGYINPGKAIANRSDIRLVESFVEEPNAETAVRYVMEGYLWNSGNFIFHAGAMQAELEQFEPEIMEASARAVANAEEDMEVSRDDDVIMVHESESIYLPIGCIHRMANPGKIPLEPIEVQVGSYLGEDDIVRLEDAYRRVSR